MDQTKIEYPKGNIKPYKYFGLLALFAQLDINCYAIFKIKNS